MLIKHINLLKDIVTNKVNINKAVYLSNQANLFKLADIIHGNQAFGHVSPTGNHISVYLQWVNKLCIFSPHFIFIVIRVEHLHRDSDPTYQPLCLRPEDMQPNLFHSWVLAAGSSQQAADDCLPHPSYAVLFLVSFLPHAIFEQRLVFKIYIRSISEVKEKHPSPAWLIHFKSCLHSFVRGP